jgi:hypothetical protein
VSGDKDRLVRALTTAAVLLVAAIAAVVSFVHIEHLAATHGQTMLAAWLLPVSVDGTVAAASCSMLWAARGGLATPWLARGMLTAGVAATLAANAAYGAPHGIPGELLSGWPAVAFVGSVEMVLSMIRRTRGRPAQADMCPWPAPAPVLPAAPAALAAPAPAPAATRPGAPGRAPARRPRGNGAPARTRTRPAGPVRTAAVSDESAEVHFAAALADGQVPSKRRIKAELHVGQDRAARIYDHLAALASGRPHVLNGSTS